MKPVIHNVREIGSNRITFTLPSWHQNNSFDRLLRSLALLTVLFFKLESNMLMVSHVSVCQFSTNQLYQEGKKSFIYEYNYVTSKPSNYRTTSKCL